MEGPLPRIQKQNHARKANQAEMQKRDDELERQNRSNRGPAPPKSPSTARRPPARPLRTSVAAPQSPKNYIYFDFNDDIADQLQCLSLGAGSNASPYYESVPNTLTPGSPSEVLAPQRPPNQSSRSAPPRPNATDATSLPPPSTAAPPPKYTRAASEPPEATKRASNTSARCSGTNKRSGKRCSNPVRFTDAEMVKVGVGKDVIVYCHHHRDRSSQVSNLPSGGAASASAKYDGLIPTYLQERTKLDLIAELDKPVSDADRAGLLYGYQLKDPDHPELVHIKVGRAIDVATRMGQWARQCGVGREPILLGSYPYASHGTVQAKTTVKYYIRLERLVHIELRDLMMYKPYKHRGFFNFEDVSVPPPTQGPQEPFGRLKPVHPNCPGCDAKHQEIFTFDPLKDGLADLEWEMLVVPVIERWAQYVDSLD